MPRPMTPDDLLAFERLGAPSASADGSVLVVPITRADRDRNRMVTRIHRLVEGNLEPLTGDDAGAPLVSPDGRHVAFLRTVGDHPQLHQLPLEGGEARPLTDFPQGVVTARWLPDSTGLLVVGRLARAAPTLEGTRRHLEHEAERQHTARTTEARLYRYWDRWLTDERSDHLFVVGLDGAEPRHVSPGLDAWLGLGPSTDAATQLAVAPDGRSAVISAATIPHGGEGEPPLPRFTLWRLALEGDARVEALTPDNPAADTGPVFLDAHTVLFGARREMDDYASPPLLTTLDLRSGEQRSLAESWDLAAAAWAADPANPGRAFVIAEQRSRMRLFALELETGTFTALTENGAFLSPVVAGDHVYGTHQSIDHPARLVRVPRGGTRTVAPEVLADPDAELLTTLDLGPVEELDIEGARGDAVQVFVVHPPGTDLGAPEKRPLVHMIHGGPHGTFGDVFHYRWNAHAFAAPGYVVALVNFHGSTSFGHESTRSIQGAWGDMPTTDVLAATDALIDRGLVDPERMAITGGSFGGFMCAWIPTQTSRFRCAIAHAAVTNLGAMLAGDWTLGLDRGLGADPVTDPARANRWSPSMAWRDHETPTLVIHGERDYRVPLAQGLELYGALRAKGVEARLVVYPDENHWILSPANAAHWYGEVRDWLGKHLRA